jgi:hypothetical protein
MFLLIIYCITVFALTYSFLEDVFKGYFKGIDKLVVISFYILGCLLWPIGVIVILCDDYKMKKQPLIKRNEKENKRKMVCEVLDEIKLK